MPAHLKMFWFFGIVILYSSVWNVCSALFYHIYIVFFYSEKVLLGGQQLSWTFQPVFCNVIQFSNDSVYIDTSFRNHRDASHVCVCVLCIASQNSMLL